MADDSFDKFLSKSLKNTEIETSSSNTDVEKLIIEKVKTNRAHKKKKQRLVLQVAVLIIALLGILGSALFPGSVYAFKEQLIQTIMKLEDNINIRINSSFSHSQVEDMMKTQIAAIQPEIPFTILIPQHIPQGYEFASIEQSTNDEQAKITISFVSENSSIMLTQTKVSEKFNISININAKQGKSEKMQVGKYMCNMITFIDGSTSLTWVTDNNIMCEISGNLTPEQAREMAASM